MSIFKWLAMVLLVTAVGNGSTITTRDVETDVAAEFLGITQKKAKFEAVDPVNGIDFRLQFFRQGKPVEGEGVLYKYNVHLNEVLFDLAICDLDHVKLGDSKKEHCRWRLKVNRQSISDDVPKSVFDIGEMAHGDFGSNITVEKGKEAPVFWFVSTKGLNLTSFQNPKNLESLLKDYPQLKIAVLSIQLK